MDQIKLGLSHLLNAKIIKQHQVGFKRQRVAKLDDDDININPAKDWSSKKPKPRTTVILTEKPSSSKISNSIGKSYEGLRTHNMRRNSH